MNKYQCKKPYTFLLYITLVILATSCGDGKKGDNSTIDDLGKTVFFAVVNNDLETFSNYIYTRETEVAYLNASTLDSADKQRRLISIDRDIERNREYTIKSFTRARDFLESNGITEWTKMRMTDFTYQLEEDNGRTFAYRCVIEFKYEEFKGALQMRSCYEVLDGWYVSSDLEAVLFGSD